MLGVPVRIHDMHGGDLGMAHLPTPMEPGDLILLEAGDYRMRDVIPSIRARHCTHLYVPNRLMFDRS